MKVRTAVVALVVIGVAGVCVRMGIWQVSRLHEKQRLNAAYRAALATTPVPLPGALAPLAGFTGRRVRASGTYDEAHQVLLSGRSLGHSPGVEVVTPLRTSDGGAVLVDRGWLPADDAMRARPQDCREAGERTVLGLLEAMPHGVGGRGWTVLAADSVTLWSARRLDLDSLGARLPYALAPYVLRALPDPAAPARPIRTLPMAPNEMMHFSYAVQWFLFAVILVVGSLLVARRGTRPRTNAPDAIPDMPRH